MQLSERISRLKTSPVRRLIPYSEKAVNQGKTLIRFNIGQPDIETPKIFFDAIQKSTPEVLSYAHSAGDINLIKAVRDYYTKRGMSYSTEDILMTAGGSEAFQFLFTAMFDEHDEILIPDPYYANYNSYFSVLNIKVTPIHTYPEDGYHFKDISSIESLITPKTKAILFSNPSNPTGVVYSKEELDMLATVAKKHNLFIISDEVYREFTYGQNKAISMGTYSDIADNVVIIDSISKRYSACGARIGCIVSKNKELMSAVYRQCQARLALPSLEMIGATALYSVPDSKLEEYRQQYESRRNATFEELQKIPDIVLREPEGAFYAFVQLPIKDSEKFLIWLLESFDIDGETIIMAPGDGFYADDISGKNKVRISYAISEDDIRRGMRILREGLAKYRQEFPND